MKKKKNLVEREVALLDDARGREGQRGGVRVPRGLLEGSGFRVQGSGFRVQGLGFRVQGQGSGFRVRVRGLREAGKSTSLKSQHGRAALIIEGSGFRVQGQGERCLREGGGLCEEGARAQRRGNTLKGFQDFYLEVKARFWP